MAKKKNWIVTAVIAVAAVTAVVGIVSVLGNSKEEKVLNGLDYTIGRIDDGSGRFDENDNSGISTKAYYKLEELESITTTDDADVVYYVNIFGADKIFTQVYEHTGDLSKETLEEYKSLGTYFKIEIVDPEDDEISMFDVSRLSKLIDVTIVKAED